MPERTDFLGYWDDWRELNRISNVFGHWDIKITVYSMISDYPGDRAGGPMKKDEKGENRYRTEIFNENRSDPIHLTWDVDHYETDKPVLGEWICIDTVKFVFLPSGDSASVLMDSAQVEKRPVWVWRYGIAYPFRMLTIPPSVGKILVSFRARLYRNPGGIVADTTIQKEMFRYESTSKGEYWWNRTD